jgi:hypothetical protein
MGKVEETAKAVTTEKGDDNVAGEIVLGSALAMTKREPIRCFEGNAKPHEAFWKFRDALEGGEAELELYGYISEYSWFEDEVTPKMFKDELYRVGKGGAITIRMHSYGGDVSAAILEPEWGM